jgi:hypothetical protein
MKSKPEAPKADEDFEADSAVETLMRANEIKSNEELMERVKKKAGRKLKALSGLQGDLGIKSLDDLKRVKKDFFKKKREEAEE